MEKLVATLTRCGFQCRMPGGTYFLYTPAPQGLADGPTFENAESASQYLITQQSICTVPWDDAGAYLRFSVTYEAADEAAEDALMAETEARLKNIRPVF
jgi:LL-diaminopimelate aminotransferase